MIPSGKYLLFGRTGVGKSSIINAISLDNIAQTSLAYACTKQIECCQVDLPCGSYVFYDSPGFCEDDDPQTDEKYFELLSSFLGQHLHGEADIKILFVARLGQTRFYSEDFDVINYLARILFKFRLPVVFVATWAEFEKGSNHVRSKLDLLRVQTLLALDRALLKISKATMCVNGFDGAFAVDNNSSVWMASWKPINIRLDSHLESSVGFEDLLGHSKQTVFDWVTAAGHDPNEIVRYGVTHLLDNRISNLTTYPLIGSLLAIDFISSGSLKAYHAAKCCLRFRLSGDLCVGVDSSASYAEELFRIRSTRDASNLLSNLPLKLDRSGKHLSVTRPAHWFYKNWSICTHLAALIAAREIAFGLNHIARAGKISILSFEKIFSRLHLFSVMFVYLFDSMGGVYLSEELTALARASLIAAEVKQINIEVLLEHIGRVSSLLYVSTMCAEFASFPRDYEDFSPRYYKPVVIEQAFGWLIRDDEVYRANAELIGKFTSCGDLRGFYEALSFVSNNALSFSKLLKDASQKLDLNVLLTNFSERSELVGHIQNERAMDCEEECGPSWIIEEELIDASFFDYHADMGVDYGYKDDSDYYK